MKWLINMPYHQPDNKQNTPAGNIILAPKQMLQLADADADADANANKENAAKH